LLSDSPAGLLGMVAIYEHRSPTEYREYWWREDDSIELYRNIPREKHEFTPVWQRKS
jgi:hypothetical protein